MTLTFVNIGLSVVRLLVLLVDKSILGSGGTSGHLGIIVLCDLLVGLLGSLRTSALHGLRNVVGGFLCQCEHMSRERVGIVTNLDGIHDEDGS
jgi:hypothetical protein